ncbi:MAG: hypothetical protein U9Q07_10535, partial [Planctomycetota bacterium]|nr:hypothetical protein [Planctomycetota bacterium]
SRSTVNSYCCSVGLTTATVRALPSSVSAAAFETTGLALKLYRNHFGTVPLAVTGDAKPLDVAAALTEDGKALTVAVVNPTEQQYELTVDLENTRLRRNGVLWRIAHTDPEAYNDPGKEPNVVINEKKISGFSNNMKLPPLSISLYKFGIRR